MTGGAPRTLATGSTKGSERLVAAERITVGLIPKVVRELDDLQTDTGMSKTDIVNRAVSLYRFLTEQLEQGEEIRLYTRTRG